MEARMAQILVRNLDDRLKGRLQRRAKRHGHSMEAEAREILRDALREEKAQSVGLVRPLLLSSAGRELDWKREKRFANGEAFLFSRSALTNDYPRYKRGFGDHASQAG
jgi:plasmid stability protein